MSRPSIRLVLAACLLAGAAGAGPLMPDPVTTSSVTLRIEAVGQVRDAGANDIASPVAIAGDLYVPDKAGGELLRRTSSGFETVAGLADGPSGATGLLNVAGTADRVFVTYVSDSQPQGVPLADTLPAGSGYDDFPTVYHVVYAFDRQSDGSLANPTGLVAFAQQERRHAGGGMLVLPSGDLLLARGDSADFRGDGMAAPQDPSSTLGALVRIDAVTGAASVLAKGLRNPQQMVYADAAGSVVAFSDIGSTAAEEINTIRLADLLDTSVVENFGWGRNASDGMAREGTFYVDDGSAQNTPVAIGMAPVPEAGFEQPYAQFGRDGVSGFFAVTGPVRSEGSFDRIDLLFGDLVSGRLFATLDTTSERLNRVFEVGLVDGAGQATSLRELVGGGRVDARLFTFGDGTAGVLSERSGVIYSLTERIAAVPVPAAGGMLMAGIVLLGAARRTRRLPRP